MLRSLQLAAAMSIALLAALGLSCSRSDSSPRVVLYTSLDDDVAQALIDAFTARTGVRVDRVGDTEATKSTGLVQRLLDEKNTSSADVWLSSEPMGTVRLEREGVLEQDALEPGRAWVPLWGRARVIVYNTNRLTPGQVPTRLRDWTSAAWKDKAGLAKPQFGTTRAHLAHLLARGGEESLRSWLAAMKANGLRLYDGNAAVTRAVGYGEIELGLADTDDAFAAQRNGWPVGFVFESFDNEPSPPGLLPSPGPLVLPCTLAIVRGAPHPEPARQLAAFLQSPEAAAITASEPWRFLPLRPAGTLEGDAGELSIPARIEPDFNALADAVPAAMRLVEEALR